MFDLLTIGDPIIDTHVQIDEACTDCQVVPGTRNQLCLAYGEKIAITDSFQSLGGNAANVAIGARRLGLSTGILSTVGEDTNGSIALHELKHHGVDTSLISFDPQHQSRYSIVLNYRGERTILSYSDEKKYLWPTTLPGIGWIYYTGLSQGYETVQEKLLEHLAKHPEIRLGVNPGSYMLKHALPALQEIIQHTHLLVLNLEEAEKIVATTLSNEKTISSLFHRLFSLGAKEVALTDAARGAWAGTKEELWHLPAYPVTPISKTGAGDAFSSGYLAARFYGKHISEALEWGIANSSSVIQKHGPHGGLQNLSGITEIIREFESQRPQKI